MIFQTLLQAQVFGFMLFIGILIGFLYECVRFICAVTKDNKYVRFIFDFAFCIIAFCIYLAGIYYCNFGELRFFTILAAVAGIFIEHFTLGFMMSKFLQSLYNIILKCYHKIIKGRKKADDTKQS